MLVSDKDKRQIMSELARGNPESLDKNSNPPDVSRGQQDLEVRDYQNFDDFAQRSFHDERRQLYGRSLHPDHIPSSQIEPELQKAIAQIKPNERYDVAREFFNHLK